MKAYKRGERCSYGGAFISALISENFTAQRHIDFVRILVVIKYYTSKKNKKKKARKTFLILCWRCCFWAYAQDKQLNLNYPRRVFFFLCVYSPLCGFP